MCKFHGSSVDVRGQFVGVVRALPQVDSGNQVLRLAWQELSTHLAIYDCTQLFAWVPEISSGPCVQLY